MLTAFVGILVLSVLVFAHELGHFVVAKRNGIAVEEFGFGFPPRLVKFGERNGTEYTLNAIPFGAFVRMRGEDDPSLPGSFASASKGARAATLFAGAGMNFLLAILLFSVLTLMTGVPDRSQPGAVIVAVAPGSPAEQAGLRAGDRIVAAGGESIPGIEALQNIIAQNLGEPIAYQITRPVPNSGGNETLEVTMVGRTNPPPSQGALGVSITSASRPAKVWEALWQGIKETGMVILLTFQVPLMLLREGRPIADAGFMGPVGITVVTGEVVRTAASLETLQPVLRLMALLSAALGITQLLPIPALDGGRLLFVLFEIIRGRRVEPAQEGMVHLIGFGLLLVLIGLLTVREIGSLLTGTFPTVGVP
jgi:regulator of sigma E protease